MCATGCLGERIVILKSLRGPLDIGYVWGVWPGYYCQTGHTWDVWLGPWRFLGVLTGTRPHHLGMTAFLGRSSYTPMV